MPAASIGSILEVVFQAQIVILSFFRDVVFIAPVAFALDCRSHFKKYLYHGDRIGFGTLGQMPTIDSSSSSTVIIEFTVLVPTLSVSDIFELI